MVDMRFGVLQTIRYIVSKWFFEEGEVHLEDWLAVQSLYFGMWLQLDSDQVFRNRYERDLSQSHWFFEELGKIEFFPRSFNKEFLENQTVLENLPILLTKHQYFGLKYQKNGGPKILIKPKTPARLKKFSKRFMGVGYRDKGSLKDKAFDGSPHWKMVFPFLVSPNEWCSTEERLAEPRRPPFIIGGE